MQDKVLEQLKKKYEYLDFDNAKVLECFYSAIEDLKSDNPSAFENKNMFGLELEHYFLYYLVLEIQKGNQEISDAVSIAMESTHDFFTRRRKDLSSNFDIKKQKELYNQSFQNTINCYYKRMNFASLLLQTLIDVYKEEIEKSKNKNITKNKEVEHMAYNMSAKSLYEVFKDYNGKLSTVIFKAFSKKEERSYALLVKKYGINLDGENAVGHLTYPEVTRLQGIMSRLHTWFKYGEYLLEQKESLESIMKFFVNTSDEKMAHIFADFQREKEAERNRAFSSKYEIMKKYNISEKTLEDAVCYIKNKDHRILYKYRYGIGLKIKPANEIRDMFGMKLDQYERTILMIQNQLPNLIKQAKEQENMLVDLNPQGVEKEASTPTIKENIKEKVKPVISSKVEVLSEEEIDKKIEEALKKSDERRSRVSSDKGVTQNLDVKKVDNNSKGATFKPKKRSKKYTYFCERCYPADIKEEEKQSIDEKIYAAFDLITSYEDGKEAAKKIYGEDLKQKAKDVSLNRLENAALGNLITKIKKIIFSWKKNESVQENKKVAPKSNEVLTFFDYFYEEGMSLEEKEEIKRKVLEFIQNSKLAGVKFAKKLYGENLDKLDPTIKLEKKERDNVNWLKSEIKKYLKGGTKLTTKEKTTKSTYQKVELKSNFCEYFYEENMSLEEQKNIREKLNKALLFNKETKAYQVFFNVYDEDLNLKEGVEVDRSTKVTISNFVNTLSRNLTVDLDELMNKNKRVMKPDTFFEYFYDPKMSLEEQEKVKAEILDIVNFIKKLYPLGYEVITLLYGDDLSSKRKKISLSPTQKSNFDAFMRYIRNYYGQDNSLKNGNYIIYHRRPLKFLMYFHKYGMSELEIKEQEEKVTAILKNQNNCDIRGYEIAKKLYGELLDSNLKPVHTDQNENSAFTVFIKSIKEILDNNVKNDVVTQKRAKYVTKKNVPITFFEYFYEEGMTKEEKEDINNKVLEFVQNSKLVGVKIAKKLYGKDLKQLNDELKLDRKEKDNFNWLRREITKYLNGDRTLESRRSRPQTFFDYFYEEGMCEEQKEEIKKLVLEQLRQKENTQGYIGTKNIYGEDFSTLQEEYNRNDAQNCLQLVKSIKDKLSDTFIDKYVLDIVMDLDKEEAEKMDELMNLITESVNNTPNEEVNEDQSDLDENIKSDEITDLNIRDEFPDIAPVEEDILEEVEEEIYMEEEIPVEEIAFDILRQQLSYKDSLILKLHNASFTQVEIMKTLSITEEDLINCYINNLELTQNIDEVLDYILVHCPDRLKDVLESSYLSSFMEELTSKEQELVYLRLLSKTNPTLTVDVISLLIDIPVEEIANYQIMSKDDVLNSLNNYINKPNYEVEKLKSKLTEK